MVVYLDFINKGFAPKANLNLFKELTMASSASMTKIQEAYVAFYGRPADAAGQAYWADRYEAEGWDAIVDAFGASAEATALYGAGGDEAQIQAIYNQMFGRDGDADGVAFYTNLLATGAASASDIAARIFDGATGDDATMLANKVAVADKYTASVAANADAVYDDAAAARTFLSSVTASTVVADVDTDAAVAADLVTASGQTFTLTAGTESVTGTDGDDTISGVVSGLSSARTLDVKDVIDGGAGDDTANFAMNSSFAGFTTDSGSMTGVETVNLTNETTISRSFDASEVSGVTSYVIDASNAAVTLTDIIEAVNLTVNNQGSGTFSVAFTDVAGTTKDVVGNDDDDALTLTMSNTGVLEDTSTDATELKSVTTTVADIEELTLALSGDNAITLGSDDHDAITVTGSGTLDLDDLGTSAKTFDGSAFTGNADVDSTSVGASGQMTSLSTGSGNDKVKIDTDDFSGSATIAGGDGDDTLEMVNSSTDVKQFTMSGVETIKVTDSADGQILSAKNWSGVEKFILMDSFDTAGNSDTLTIANMGAASLTVELNGAASTDDIFSVDNTGDITVNTVASTATAKKAGTSTATADTNDNDVTANSATGAFTMTIGANTVADGTYSANKATSASLTIESALDSDEAELTGAGSAFVFNANKASSVAVVANGTMNGEVASTDASSFTFESAGAFTGTTLDFDKATSAEITTAKAGTLVVQTEKAEVMSITAAKALTVTNTTTVLQELTVDTGAAFVMTNAALADIAVINVTGSETASSAQFVALGDGSNDYDMTITASGLKGGFTATTLDVAAGADIRLDASAVTGNITVTNIDAAATAGDAAVVDIKAGGKALSIGTIAAATSIDVTASKATTVGIGAISGSTTADVTLDLNGATGAITLAAITGKGVTVKANEALSTVTYAGDITATKNVDIRGSELSDNDIDGTGAGNVVLKGTAQTVNFTGGIGDDTLLIDTFTTNTSVTVTGSWGIGTDTLAVDLNTAAIAQAYALDVTGASGYDTGTFTLSDEAYDATVKLGSNEDTDNIVMTAGTNKATITGFDTTEDNLDVQAIATGGANAIAANAAAGAITDTAAYVFADGADGTGAETIADYTDLADVAAFLDAAFSDEASTNVIFAAINDLVGEKTYLYIATAQADNSFDDGVVLLGTITEESGAALVSGDLVS
jgi:hypothetical protein